MLKSEIRYIELEIQLGTIGVVDIKENFGIVHIFRGHVGLQITMDTYSHVLPELQEESLIETLNITLNIIPKTNCIQKTQW